MATSAPDEVSRSPGTALSVGWMEMGLVDLSNVAVGESGRPPVLSAVDLSVERGERFALLGASGAGKTLLLRVIAGLDEPLEGAITVRGRSPRRADPTVTMVFEEETVYDHLDVGGNLAFPLEISGVGAGDRVRKTAQRFSIAGLLDRPARALSVGERRIVAAARSLTHPGRSLLLLDDALVGMDNELRRRFLSAVMDDPDLTVLFASREPKEVMRWADRVAVISGGRVAQIGDPVTVWRHPVSLDVAELIDELDRIPGTVSGDLVEVGVSRLAMPPGVSLPDGARVVVGVRPSHLSLAEPATPFHRRIAVTVGRVEPLGDRVRALFGLGSQRGMAFVAELGADARVHPGDRVDLAVELETMGLYEPVSGLAIRSGSAGPR